MTHEPEIKTEADLLPWAMAHRARSAERWDNQDKLNSAQGKHLAKFEERMRCIERMVAKWSMLAAIIGGGLGALLAALIRYAVSHH